MTLKDNRIVALGGTSGIGLAVAQAALEEGASVVVASRQAEDVTRAREQLVQQSKFRSSGLTVDVTSEDALKEFFAIVGPFDHLVYTNSLRLSMTFAKSTSEPDPIISVASDSSVGVGCRVSTIR